MAARRSLVVLIVLLVALGLGLLLDARAGPRRMDPPKLVMLVAFVGTAPWTGLCFANAVIGFVLLLRQPKAARDAHLRADPFAHASRSSRRCATRTCGGCCRRCGACWMSWTRRRRGRLRAVHAVRHGRRRRGGDRTTGGGGISRGGSRPGPHPLPPAHGEHRLQGRQHHGFPRPPCRRVRADADPGCRFRHVGRGRVAAGARHAGRSDTGDRAAPDRGIAGIVRLPSPVPVRHARRDAHLGDRSGLVAGRRRPLLGPQRGGPHRAVSRALPAAAAAGRQPYPVARSGRGRDAALAPAGAFACCRKRKVPGRRTHRRCRNSSAANCAGWLAICNTGICCGCLDCGRWAAGS